jgi:hypothetical protein
MMMPATLFFVERWQDTSRRCSEIGEAPALDMRSSGL